MAFVNRLCNPTPWDAKLNWERGVNLRVPAFGHVDLTMQQMDDFRDGKPGSEAVMSTLDFFGLFLFDADRPYDNQAVEALKRMHAARKTRYNDAVNAITRRRTSEGVQSNPELLEELLQQHGYAQLRDSIGVLAEQIKGLEKVVTTEERSTRQKFDPARTVFVTDPPREFPSVAAMNFFLDRNPEIKAKHVAFTQQANNVQE